MESREPHPGEGIASAETLIARSVRVVELSDGAKVKIRKVCRDELLAKGLLPQVVSLVKPGGVGGVPANPQELEQEIQVFPAMVDAVLSLGLVEPRAWIGSDADCPEGQVPVRWLGAYREELFALIFGASGYSEEAAKAASFPRPEGTGGLGDSGSQGGGQEPAPVATDGDR